MDPPLALVAAIALFAGLLGLGLYVRRQLRRIRREVATRPPAPPPAAPSEATEAEELLGRLDALQAALASERTRLDRVEDALAPRSKDPVARLEAQLELAEKRLGDHEERLGKARGWATDVGGRLTSLTEEVGALAAKLGDSSSDEDGVDRLAEDAILTRLRRDGLREIRLLEDAEDPAARRFEARRGSLIVKGRAVLDPQGHVVVRVVPSVRAFP